jgi:sugar-specific transcriptional regulator TrmB
MASLRASEALVGFGYTALESEIYAFLLQEHPSTGYRVAQVIGKPAANVYKALEALERKAAVLVEGTNSKEYRPVAPDRLFSRLEKEFLGNKSSAIKTLSALGKTDSVGKVFTVSNRDQAVAQTRTLLASAKETALFIGSEDFAIDLKSDLKSAWVMTSCDIAAEQHISVPAEMFEVPTLQVVVDGRSALFASGSDSSFQGFWFENHPLGASMHQAIVCQIGLYQVDRALDADAGRKQISKIIENLP